MKWKIFNFFVATDDLLQDNSSFLYGQNPKTAQIPIYAMISLCDSTIPTVPIPSVHLNGE